MKLDKIKIIIGREYMVRVKKKSFILMTILTPLFFALMITIPSLIMIYSGEDVKKVIVIDNSGITAPYFQKSDKIEYAQAEKDATLEGLKANFDNLGVYAVVDISPVDEQGDVSVTSYSKEPLSVSVKSNISKSVNEAIKDYKLKSYNIENLDQIMKHIKSDVKINSLTLTEGGGEKKDNVEIYMAIAYVLGFLIYGFIFMFGSMVMRGVIEEKTNRIVEVIVSSVSSFELMMGKILGVAAVALTQFVIWIFLTIGLVAGIKGVFGEKIFSSSNQAEQLMAASGTAGDAAVTGMIPVQNLTQDTEELNSSEKINISQEDNQKEDSFMQDIFSQLMGINYLYIIGCFIIYFILGYLLYAAMFAAVGSAVDNEADTQQLVLPITIPLIIGMFIMLHTFQHPNSPLSFWASVIPFTSPMVMLARIPFGIVPAWELTLSIVLLAVTFIVTTYFSGKIYRVGILMYGKKASFKDLFKWLKYKN